MIVLCNHLGFQSHADRVRGLTDNLASFAQGFPVVQIFEGGDDPVRSEARLKDAFRAHPAAVAIYNVGAANRGVVGAIRAGLLQQAPVFIGHELTAFTWESLRKSIMTLTIDQSPELQAQFAIDVLLNHCNFAGAMHVTPPYAATVPIVLYGPENLPDKAPDQGSEDGNGPACSASQTAMDRRKAGASSDLNSRGSAPEIPCRLWLGA